MTTPSGEPHRRRLGPLWAKTGPLRPALAPPVATSADYAASAGAAAIAALMADEAPLVASCKVLEDTRM